MTLLDVGLHAWAFNSALETEENTFGARPRFDRRCRFGAGVGQGVFAVGAIAQTTRSILLNYPLHTVLTTSSKAINREDTIPEPGNPV